MTPKNLTDETRALGQRAAKCVRVYNETHDWQEVLKADSLMVYSTDFRKFVAEKCGLKENGEPLSGVSDNEREELAEADAAIEEEEAEEEEEEEEAEEEEVEEEVEEEEVPVASFDDCHWCGSAPATVCLSVLAQGSDGENRLVRLDHLCADCAAAYWTALHNVQKERMF